MLQNGLQLSSTVPNPQVVAARYQELWKARALSKPTSTGDWKRMRQLRLLGWFLQVIEVHGENVHNIRSIDQKRTACQQHISTSAAT
jgi:hypothetical protein